MMRPSPTGLREALEIEMPTYRAIGGVLKEKMRYGENPHQSAGFYLTGDNRPGCRDGNLLQGKQLSYNNINDTDAAFELVAEFPPENGPACAIIKHANPCGVATGSSLVEAYKRALACDSTSAFGGIIALNQILDAETAQEIVKLFTEVIIAPEVTDEAKAIIAAKPNLRLLTTGALPDPRARGRHGETVSGGLLVQSRDNVMVRDLELKVVTKRAADRDRARRHEVRLQDRQARQVECGDLCQGRPDGGIGAGQMSRVDSARIAALKAEDAAKALGLAETLTKGFCGCVGSFLSLRRWSLAAIAAGATAVIQRAVRCVTMRSSRLPMRMALPWSSPASATSATERISVHVRGGPVEKSAGPFP